MNPLAVVGDAWRLYSEHWRRFSAIGLAIFAVVAVIGLLLGLAGTFGVFVTQIFVLAGSVVLAGAVVTTVERLRRDGAETSVAEAIGSTRGVFWTLLAAGILAGIGIGIGLVLFIFPGVVLATFWWVIAPCIVLERTGVLGAFGRSMRLVRRQGWATFGVLALTWVVMILAGLVVAIVLGGLPPFLAGFIATLIQGAFFAPFAAIAVTLTYFRLAELPDVSLRRRR